MNLAHPRNSTTLAVILPQLSVRDSVNHSNFSATCVRYYYEQNRLILVMGTMNSLRNDFSKRAFVAWNSLDRISGAPPAVFVQIPAMQIWYTFHNTVELIFALICDNIHKWVETFKEQAPTVSLVQYMPNLLPKHCQQSKVTQKSTPPVLFQTSWC